MKYLATALLGLAMLAGGCSDASGAETEIPQGPTPAEGLDAAVRSASQALIALPGVGGLEFTYGPNDELTTTRWLRWTASGDTVLVVAGPTDIGGLVQVGGDLMVATTGAAGDTPWKREAPPLETRGDPGVAFNLDLPAMANGSVLRSLDGMTVTDVVVTSTATEDGGISWRLSNPLKGATATREWLIDSTGVLRSYSLSSDTDEPIFGEFAWVEAVFDPVAVPATVVLPEEGAELDLDQLGLPPDIPLP